MALPVHVALTIHGSGPLENLDRVDRPVCVLVRGGIVVHVVNARRSQR